MTEMKPEDVTDIATFLEWCSRYEGQIFVREQVNGVWRTLALSSLLPEYQAHHMNRWLDENRLPVRVKSDEEMNECLDKNQLSE